MPAHVRLRNYLAGLPRESEFILTSPKGDAYRKTSVTNLVCTIATELGFKGYSPHGLSHLAGAALANGRDGTADHGDPRSPHSEASDALHPQINRTRLAEDADGIWERADNVVPIYLDGRDSWRTKCGRYWKNVLEKP